VSWRAYIAVLLFLGLVSIAFLVATSGESESESVGDSRKIGESENRSIGYRTSDIGYRTSDIGYRRSEIGYRRSEIGDRTSDIGYRISDIGYRISDDPTIRRSDDQTTGGPTGQWSDPTNERVLGSKDWMAEVSEEDNERIDEVFERARAARFDPSLSPRDRRSSIEVAEEVVDGCFEELQTRFPAVEGRLIVEWESGASGGQGWIRAPRITTNYRLRDPTFEECVIGRLDGRTFPSADGEPITVEYPFFYDGT